MASYGLMVTVFIHAPTRIWGDHIDGSISTFRWTDATMGVASVAMSKTIGKDFR